MILNRAIKPQKQLKTFDAQNSEGAVFTEGYNTVIRWIKKFCLDSKNVDDQASSSMSKTVVSKVILSVIEANPGSKINLLCWNHKYLEKTEIKKETIGCCVILMSPGLFGVRNTFSQVSRILLWNWLTFSLQEIPVYSTTLVEGLTQNVILKLVAFSIARDPSLLYHIGRRFNSECYFETGCLFHCKRSQSTLPHW